MAIDYEYASVDGAWGGPGFALSGRGSCSRQAADGAWDAGHGYAGIALDLGDPLGLAVHTKGLARAKAVLRSAENCFARGYAGVSPHARPVIYVGFSNCVPAAGAAGICGSRSAATARYRRAGATAAAYVASGNADVKGTWVDFESDWSTVAAVHAEVLGYLSASLAKTGRSQWCDSSYRNDAPGVPNHTWTVAAMVRRYVSPLLQAGYNCLGTGRILIPQAYAASWLTDAVANFSPASSLARYVGGITVCGARESAGWCPDLGIPAPAARATKWYDFQHDGYLGAASSVLAVVAGGLLRLAV